MKLRMIVAATSAALFSLGAIAAGDDKQKQSQGQQQGAQKSQSATGASGSASGGSGSMSTSGQSSKSAAGGASASQQSQAQGGAQSSDMVKQVQQKLSQEGHQIQADGIMGPKTQAALKEYQEKNKLEATGNLDKETLSSLGVSGDMGGSSAATGGSSAGQSKGQTQGQTQGQSQKKQ